MEKVYAVRHRHLVEHVPIRQLSREMGIPRNTIRRYIRGAEPGVGKPRGIAGHPVRNKVLQRAEAILGDSKQWREETERTTVTTQGHHAETISGVAAAQLVFDDLKQLLVAIEPMQEQLSVFGHKPRQLLLLACMEVDSALKAIGAANGSTMERPNINHHSRLARPMRLGEWEVRLARSRDSRFSR